MPRNFYRRVEVMFPVEQEDLKDRILHEIVPAYLKDNVKARILQPDCVFTRRPLAEGEAPFRVQEQLLSLPTAASAAADLRLMAALNSNGGNHEVINEAMQAEQNLPTAAAEISGSNGAEGNGSQHSETASPAEDAAGQSPS